MISVIIPAFNEAPTIGHVVDIVRTWSAKKEVIVVNDGSTDTTAVVLKKFGRSIHVISLARNKGKGNAVAQGIEKSKGGVILLVDGDVIGLTHNDLDRLTTPLVQGKADMTLGLVRFWRLKTFGPRKEITGQRAFFRDTARPHLKTMKTSGYGLELFLNKLHRNKRVMDVAIPTVYIVDKLAKQSFGKAIASYWKEWKEVALHYIQYG